MDGHTHLDEVFDSLARNRPDLDPAKLTRTRELMGAAICDVLVVGHEPLIDVVDLPDPDDRHVLAAAIKARAQVIVTQNLRDFPRRGAFTRGVWGRWGRGCCRARLRSPGCGRARVAREGNGGGHER